MSSDSPPPADGGPGVPNSGEPADLAARIETPPGSVSVRRLRHTRRIPWRGIFLTLLISGLLCGSVYWWVHSLIMVSTDNAYVVGNITPISAEVSGMVVALFIDDNMMVQAGDPIAQIDPVPFHAQVDQALADFLQAQSDARAALVNVGFYRQDRKSLLESAMAKQAEAEQGVRLADFELRTRAQILAKDKELLASLQAQEPGLVAIVANARDYLERFNRLSSTGDVPVQDRDNREATYREAMAKLRSLQSNTAAAERQVLASELQIREAETRLEQSRKALASAQALVGRGEAAQLEPQAEEQSAIALENKVRQAEAKLRLARLSLSNTLIRAPIPGIISRRTIQLGQTVEARKPFLSIVPLDLDNVWVVANFREEQMARIRVGQRTELHVDGIPERAFAGWVDSVAGGTGSVFSLFPPDNATGNFVRIVQRLSVRVRFQEPANYQNRIRPGMSARIVIDTTDFVRQSGQHW
jgi:membrane fusion protein, multidrug efflux system